MTDKIRSRLKKIVFFVLGEITFRRIIKSKNYINNLIKLYIYYFYDLRIFFINSNVFYQNSYEKLEALIILKYHSLEKGFLHKMLRYKFGKQNVIELLEILKIESVIKNIDRSQIQAAIKSICYYYEIHKKEKIDISDYFTEEEYFFLRSKLIIESDPFIIQNDKDFINNTNKNFMQFSHSRHSIREYADINIPIDVIENVIELARNAPSVCNRQSVKVYFTANKDMIREILDIQGGLKGFSDKIPHLFIVTGNLNYFYTIEERNQLYIDGGIFLMNLLYSLHFYKIVSCPAHWALPKKADAKVQKILGFSNSEKVISLVTFGYPKVESKACLSLRRSTTEILNLYHK